MKALEECEGYKKLLAAVERDEKEQPGGHDYRKKFQWALDRAKHDAEKLNMEAADILDAWEKSRDYWYMNYYQNCNQPEIAAGKVRVFEKAEDLRAAIGKNGFRCPKCGGVSSSPYECKAKAPEGCKACAWKSYGLLGTLDRGIYI